MLSRLSSFKKSFVSKTKVVSEHNVPKTKYVRWNSGVSSKADQLLNEFGENFHNLMKENKYTEADKAFLSSRSLKNKKDEELLDLFRGLHSVTQAFEQTNGANTKEARELISTFRKILQRTEVENDPNVEPVKIAVTGAAGSIGYAILLRIASGDLLGKDVPVQLHLLEVPEALTSLEGVVMELNDCAFPLLRGVKTFSNPEEAFEDVDFALLVGAQPRTKGMERKDLLMKNGDIFTVQGRALDKSAKKSVKVVVVGNPANTNCLIASNNAPSIPVENFSAMTRLDHNRGLSQLTQKLNISLSDIENFAIWGNHSSTQFPSIEHCLINGKPARKVINDDEWILKTFIPVVQNRGAEIIKVRGASSAASAGSAAIDHIHDWVLGTNGEWTSMGVYSNGDYGVTPGLFYSYPVLTSKGEYEIVQDLQLDPFTAEKLELTHQELLQERDSVSSLLKL